MLYDYLLFFNLTDHIPRWWIWGYWVSPLMYAQNAASVNEFLGNSWDKVTSLNIYYCFLSSCGNSNDFWRRIKSGSITIEQWLIASICMLSLNLNSCD